MATISSATLRSINSIADLAAVMLPASKTDESGEDARTRLSLLDILESSGSSLDFPLKHVDTRSEWSAATRTPTSTTAEALNLAYTVRSELVLDDGPFGVIEPVLQQDDSGLALQFQINSASSSDPDGTFSGGIQFVHTTHYVRGKVIDEAANNAQSSQTGLRYLEQATSGSPRMWIQMTQTDEGFRFILDPFSDSGLTRNELGQTVPFVRWGEWVRIDLTYRRDTSTPANGIMQIYINGVLSNQITGDMTQFTDNVGRMRYAMAARDGIKWQVCGPMTVRNTEPTLMERYGDQFGPDSQNYAMYLPGIDDPYKASVGSILSRTVSGSPTVTTSTYGTSGVTWFRHRFTISGASSEVELFVNEAPGRPKRYNGWTCAVLPDLYLQDGELDVQIGGYQLQFSGGNIAIDGTNHATYDTAKRFAVVLQWGPDGVALIRHNLETMTAGHGNANTQCVEVYTTSRTESEYVQSPIWNVRPGASTMEIGGILFADRWNFCGADSMTSAPAAGISPSARAHNHLAAYTFGFGGLRSAGMWGQHLSRTRLLDDQPLLPINTGQSGITYGGWADNLTDQLANAGPNSVAILMDGPSINNISQIDNSSELESQLNSIWTQLIADVTWARSRGRGLWYGTMIPRNASNHYADAPSASVVDFRLEAINRLNEMLRVVAADHSDVVELSDLYLLYDEAAQASWINTSNAPHTTQNGSIRYGEAFVATRRRYTRRSRHVTHSVTVAGATSTGIVSSFLVPRHLDGAKLVELKIRTRVAGSGGTTTVDAEVGGVSLLSAAVSVTASTAVNSGPGAIGSNSVSEDDIVDINVESIESTPAQDLTAVLVFQLPE